MLTAYCISLYFGNDLAIMNEIIESDTSTNNFPDNNIFEKCGTFEWIVSLEDIQHFFNISYTGLPQSYSGLKVLVIGSGTSSLSSDLLGKFSFSEVVSVDNDEQCVKHMQRMWSCESRLLWYHFDVIEDTKTYQGNLLDHDEYFDIVVDKGTLDAVLVEGSIANMLEYVKRKLKLAGVYIVCSINSQQLLCDLFSLKPLEFYVSVHNVEISPYKVGSIAICRKMGSSPVDLLELAKQEKEVMDFQFKTANPLLTEDYIKRLSAAFEAVTSQTWLPLMQAFEIMFSKELSYTWSLFLEDLQDFALEKEGQMTKAEMIAFIEQMQ